MADELEGIEVINKTLQCPIDRLREWFGVDEGYTLAEIGVRMQHPDGLLAAGPLVVEAVFTLTRSTKTQPKPTTGHI